jgi:hypothetical protein
MNSGRPAKESLPKSVPGIPQQRSAPKFSHDDMYMSELNWTDNAISVSVIRSIDLKNDMCREIQSLSTSRMVLLILFMT